MSIALAWLLSTAHAWPADDAWLALEVGGQPIEDAQADHGASDDATDLTGDPYQAAGRWHADSAVVQLRMQVAADPIDGVDLADLAWVWLAETDGNDVLDAALVVEGPLGELRGYTLDGSGGLQPGWTSIGVLGDVAGGQVRTGASAYGTWFVDLEVSRADLLALGIDDATTVRWALVTGPDSVSPWTDSAVCSGVCADVPSALADGVTIDGDLDGWTTPFEVALGTDPLDADTDDDGLIDGDEPSTDTDGAGSPDPLDCDSDNDGIVDGTEAGLFLAQLHPDTDTSSSCWRGDADTTNLPTDPRVRDTDGGGIDDGVEDLNRDGALGAWETDPTDPTDDVDTDGDGIADVLELLGADGSVDDVDSDGDGLDDDLEGLTDLDGDGTPNFLDDDSDGDGISDAVEGDVDSDGDETIDAWDADSDDDGSSDASEGDGDTDGDGVPDYLDDDSDGDGIPDATEGTGDYDGDGTPNRIDLDSDDDGLLDADEGTVDSDGAGSPDYLDTDSDNDGIPDGVEGLDDVDGDGLANYVDTNSDGRGDDDRTEGTDDLDCDGVPNFLDPDDEDGFCDDAQDPPGETGSGAPPGGDAPVEAGSGQFTGGACSTSPGRASWAFGIALFAAAFRRRGAILLLALPAAATAQEVNAQRFSPVVDGGPFARLVDADPGEQGSGGLGIWLNHANDPLVFRTADDSEIAMLGTVTTGSAVASASLGAVRVGVDLPVHIRTSGISGDRLGRFGDLRLSSEVRVLDPDGARLGAWLDGTLPTGATEQFVGAGRGGIRTGVALQAEGGPVQGVLNLGVRSGTGRRMGGLIVGPALIAGLGGSVALSDELSAALEIDREDWLGNAGESGAHPTEWLGSIRAESGVAALTLGGGTGLTPGIGAPDFRVVSGLVVTLGVDPE